MQRCFILGRNHFCGRFGLFHRFGQPFRNGIRWRKVPLQRIAGEVFFQKPQRQFRIRHFPNFQLRIPAPPVDIFDRQQVLAGQGFRHEEHEPIGFFGVPAKRQPVFGKSNGGFRSGLHSPGRRCVGQDFDVFSPEKRFQPRKRLFLVGNQPKPCLRVPVRPRNRLHQPRKIRVKPARLHTDAALLIFKKGLYRNFRHFRGFAHKNNGYDQIAKLFIR